ncbi:MAG: fibronectin type III domain-containing protein [Deltaproteobacteria bacterium]|nr:fibronectin type III domain-containing protein [Deltaproteobacteria bacterium]
MKRIIKVWSDARVQCFLVVLVLSFACPAYGIDISLRWDPSVEPDLAGYKIYYKTGSSGPPYNGWDASEGDSPIEIDTYQVLVGNVCEYTLSDLNEAKNYYFVVTAYDAEGNGSAYSNEVCFNCADLDGPPAISDVWPFETEPRTKVVLFGSGFGNRQLDSVVHIGPKSFDLGHSRVKFWSDTIIEIKIPFGNKGCEWWKGKDLKEQKVWATVGGMQSNEKTLEVIKPDTCP